MGARFSRGQWGPGVKAFESDIAQGTHKCSPYFAGTTGLGPLEPLHSRSPSLLLSFIILPFQPWLSVSWTLKSPWPANCASACDIYIQSTMYSAEPRNRCCTCPGQGRGWAHTPPLTSRNTKCSQGMKSAKASSHLSPSSRPSCPYGSTNEFSAGGHGGYWGRKQFLATIIHF